MKIKNKKIVFVSPDYPPSVGGVERYVSEMANYLSGLDYPVWVVCGTRINRALRHIAIERSGKILVMRIPTFSIGGMDFPKKFSSYFFLWKILKKAVLIHLNDVRLFFSTIWLGKVIFRYKLLLTSHGFIFHTRRFYYIKKVYSKYFTWVVNHYFDKVITVGQPDHDFCRQQGIENELINEGVDINKYISMRKRLQRGMYLYFGRIDRNKNLGSLILCLKEWHKNNSDFHLNICGTGDKRLTSDLEKLVHECSLGGVVSFLGRVSEQKLLYYLSYAEFVFIPSKFESFGYTFIEALASGSVVIAQKNKQFLSLVGNTNAAVLVDFHRTDDFLKAIEYAKKNYALLSEEARKFALNFTIEKMLTSNERVIQSLLISWKKTDA